MSVADTILKALRCERDRCACTITHERGQGLTHCPNTTGHQHADADPSLSATDRDGKLLLSCKSGCTNDQVIVALRERGLWGTKASGGKQEVARYRYVDRQGQHLFDVIRYEPKDFRQQAADGSWSLRNVEPVIYRLDEVIPAIERGETIWIVEGEKDVDALRGLGIVATCNPMGAGKWVDRYAADFVGATVVVVADRDEPGRQHAKAIARSLSVVAKSIRVIEMPGAHDVSEWIATARSGRGGLDDLVAKAPEWEGGDAKVILTAKELVDEYRGTLDRRRKHDPDEIGWPTGFFEFDVIPVRYRPRDLWLVVSATGVGKTTFLLTLMHLAKIPSLFVTMEQPRVQLMDRTIASMTKVNSAFLAKGDITDEQMARVDRALTKLSGEPMYMVDQPGLTTDALDPIVRAARARFGVRLVFVDYAQKMADKYGESEYQRVTRISNNLARMASATGVCIIAATQVSRKYRSSFGSKEDRHEGDPPRLSDIRDSGYLEQDASVVLAIGRAEDSNQAKVAIRKNRHGLTGPVITFWFDGEHNRFVAMQHEAEEKERPYL